MSFREYLAQRRAAAAIRPIGPDDLQRGSQASFETDDGQLLKGQVVDWGPKGTKIHVLDDLHGDRLLKVPYPALRTVQHPVTAVPSHPEPPPNLFEPGDLVSVTKPLIGTFEAVVVETPAVLLALDDGRPLYARLGELSEVRPGAGVARLQALRKRWAENPGSGPAGNWALAEIERLEHALEQARKTGETSQGQVDDA